MVFNPGRSLTRERGRTAKVEIPCSKCRLVLDPKERNECPRCGTIVRRCVDCEHFDRGWNYCYKLDTDVRPKQARNPGKLAISSKCPHYEHVGPE